MLKLKSNKLKLFGIITCGLVLGISYLGLSFYSIPEKVSAAETETRKLTNIKYLQEMNINICNNSAIGDTNTLIDIRDDNEYTIGKLADGKCWMTQNLRLAGNTALTPDDSNITHNFTLPSSNSGNFRVQGDDGDISGGQMRNATDTNYGAYYSFNAATANSRSFQDICPKGWKLPTGGSGSEFQTLYNTWTTATWTVNNTNGRWLGATNTTSGGAFFPAAGTITDNGLNNIGTQGAYWSNTIGMSSSSRTYALIFSNSSIQTGSSTESPQYYGFSIRCIANEAITESEDLSTLKPSDSASGSIAVKVANTISIDAVSGMEEEVDSTKIAEGTITATVATNSSNYKVLLSAEQTSLTPADTITNTSVIPASEDVVAGTNAWGIKNSDNTTYSAITSEAKEYYNTTENSTNPLGIKHTFGVGISVSPSLPADTYSTEVAITAAAV